MSLPNSALRYLQDAKDVLLSVVSKNIDNPSTSSGHHSLIIDDPKTIALWDSSLSLMNEILQNQEENDKSFQSISFPHLPRESKSSVPDMPFDYNDTKLNFLEEGIPDYAKTNHEDILRTYHSKSSTIRGYQALQQYLERVRHNSLHPVPKLILKFKKPSAFSDGNGEELPTVIFSYENEPFTGWTRLLYLRHSGKTKGKVDIHYLTPDGSHRFRSRGDLQAYLTMHPQLLSALNRKHSVSSSDEQAQTLGSTESILRYFSFASTFCVCQRPDEEDEEYHLQQGTDYLARDSEVVQNNHQVNGGRKCFVECSYGKCGCHGWMHPSCVGLGSGWMLQRLQQESEYQGDEGHEAGVSQWPRLICPFCSVFLSAATTSSTNTATTTNSNSNNSNNNLGLPTEAQTVLPGGYLSLNQVTTGYDAELIAWTDNANCDNLLVSAESNDNVSSSSRGNKGGSHTPAYEGDGPNVLNNYNNSADQQCIEGMKSQNANHSNCEAFTSSTINSNSFRNRGKKRKWCIVASNTIPRVWGFDSLDATSSHKLCQFVTPVKDLLQCTHPGLQTSQPTVSLDLFSQPTRVRAITLFRDIRAPFLFRMPINQYVDEEMFASNRKRKRDSNTQVNSDDDSDEEEAEEYVKQWSEREQLLLGPENWDVVLRHDYQETKANERSEDKNDFVKMRTDTSVARIEYTSTARKVLSKYLQLVKQEANLNHSSTADSNAKEEVKEQDARDVWLKFTGGYLQYDPMLLQRNEQANADNLSLAIVTDSYQDKNKNSKNSKFSIRDGTNGSVEIPIITPVPTAAESNQRLSSEITQSVSAKILLLSENRRNAAMLRASQVSDPAIVLLPSHTHQSQSTNIMQSLRDAQLRSVKALQPRQMTANAMFLQQIQQMFAQVLTEEVSAHYLKYQSSNEPNIRTDSVASEHSKFGQLRLPLQHVLLRDGGVRSVSVTQPPTLPFSGIFPDSDADSDSESDFDSGSNAANESPKSSMHSIRFQDQNCPTDTMDVVEPITTSTLENVQLEEDTLPCKEEGETIISRANVILNIKSEEERDTDTRRIETSADNAEEIADNTIEDTQEEEADVNISSMSALLSHLAQQEQPYQQSDTGFPGSRWLQYEVRKHKRCMLCLGSLHPPNESETGGAGWEAVSVPAASTSRRNANFPLEMKIHRACHWLCQQSAQLPPLSLSSIETGATSSSSTNHASGSSLQFAWMSAYNKSSHACVVLDRKRCVGCGMKGGVVLTASVAQQLLTLLANESSNGDDHKCMGEETTLAETQEATIVDNANNQNSIQTTGTDTIQETTTTMEIDNHFILDIPDLIVDPILSNNAGHVNRVIAEESIQNVYPKSLFTNQSHEKELWHLPCFHLLQYRPRPSEESHSNHAIIAKPNYGPCEICHQHSGVLGRCAANGCLVRAHPLCVSLSSSDLQQQLPVFHNHTNRKDSSFDHSSSNESEPQHTNHFATGWLNLRRATSGSSQASTETNGFLCPMHTLWITQRPNHLHPQLIFNNDGLAHTE